MRISTVLGDSFHGLRKNVSMALSVILVTMVSMYLLGLGLLAQRQADQMKGYWYDRVQVSIYLCTDDSMQGNCEGGGVTDEQKETIAAQLDEMKPLVKEVYHETEEQAFERFQEQFKNSPIAGNVRVGDIPQSYRVSLSDPTKYDVVVSSFEGAPGVASVQDQEKVLKKFFTVINRVTFFSVLLAGLMVLCAVLLMATTVRQAAFTRRREISIMKLVGASNATIRTPLLLETIIAGLIGAGLAVALLWSTVHFIFSRYLNTVVLDQAMIGTSDVWFLAPFLVVGVVVLAAVTASVTLWRYLRV
ncbi:permease-like cell division protein FtsX [Janibacter sp. G56]|uniref:permease-like cell division protein FtsX n=1 Tax=Janibacter sp. G56 TaxID=3418717 RepID=UPI003D0865CF